MRRNCYSNVRPGTQWRGLVCCQHQTFNNSPPFHISQNITLCVPSWHWLKFSMYPCRWLNWLNDLTLIPSHSRTGRQVYRHTELIKSTATPQTEVHLKLFVCLMKGYCVILCNFILEIPKIQLTKMRLKLLHWLKLFSILVKRLNQT